MHAYQRKRVGKFGGEYAVLDLILDRSPRLCDRLAGKMTRVMKQVLSGRRDPDLQNRLDIFMMFSCLISCPQPGVESGIRRSC